MINIQLGDLLIAPGEMKEQHEHMGTCTSKWSSRNRDLLFLLRHGILGRVIFSGDVITNGRGPDFFLNLLNSCNRGFKCRVGGKRLSLVIVHARFLGCIVQPERFKDQAMKFIGTLEVFYIYFHEFLIGFHI
jgi:hypothetical protein